MQIKDNVLRDVNTSDEIYLIDLNTNVKAIAYHMPNSIILIRDEITSNDLKRSDGVIKSIKSDNCDLEELQQSLTRIAKIEKQISQDIYLPVEFFLEDNKYEV